VGPDAPLEPLVADALQLESLASLPLEELVRLVRLVLAASPTAAKNRLNDERGDDNECAGDEDEAQSEHVERCVVGAKDHLGRTLVVSICL
jgi:hypothetical protein